VSETHSARQSRLLAAGLSPAWQQILVVDEFRAGEVNRAGEVHWCASGKVLNVGIAIAHLAGNERAVRTLSVIGRRARAALEPELAALGIDCRWVETAAETRICTTIVDRSSGRTTELVENAAPLTADEIARFCDAFSEESAAADTIVLSLVAGRGAGYVVSRYSPNRGAQATEAASDRGDKTTLLAGTLNCQFNTDADVHTAMHRLNDRGAQWVVVTNGANPIWASNNGRLYRFEPLRVQRIVNPIGSGDCLAAGIAWAASAGLDMPGAIRLGIAAAADNVEQLLPARIDRRRIEQRAEEATMKVV
jgi:fructose-1-phosphate kinase PfkB-like protein